MKIVVVFDFDGTLTKNNGGDTFKKFNEISIDHNPEAIIAKINEGWFDNYLVPGIDKFINFLIENNVAVLINTNNYPYFAEKLLQRKNVAIDSLSILSTRVNGQKKKKAGQTKTSLLMDHLNQFYAEEKIDLVVAYDDELNVLESYREKIWENECQFIIEHFEFCFHPPGCLNPEIEQEDIHDFINGSTTHKYYESASSMLFRGKIS